MLPTMAWIYEYNFPQLKEYGQLVIDDLSLNKTQKKAVRSDLVSYQRLQRREVSIKWLDSPDILGTQPKWWLRSRHLTFDLVCRLAGV